MKWINKHVSDDIYNSYNEKYGNEDYWNWQNKMYEHPDILLGLKQVIQKATRVKSILSIGINNALEIEVLKNLSNLSWEWDQINITGVDLSISALKQAKTRMEILGINHKLINADISEINTFKHSFDLCIAITSLQSAVIYDSDFRLLLEKITTFMKSNASFLITAPNCSIQDGNIIRGGAYNVRYNKQDPEFAMTFIKECSTVLYEKGFSNIILGNEFISLISQRIIKSSLQNK